MKSDFIKFLRFFERSGFTEVTADVWVKKPAAKSRRLFTVVRIHGYVYMIVGVSSVFFKFDEAGKHLGMEDV
jgi:hypothetical protein